MVFVGPVAVGEKNLQTVLEGREEMKGKVIVSLSYKVAVAVALWDFPKTRTSDGRDGWAWPASSD